MMRLKTIREKREEKEKRGEKKEENEREEKVEENEREENRISENGDQYGESKDSCMHERYQC